MSVIITETSLRVTLVHVTKDPEKVIGSAARLCYSESDASDLCLNYFPKEASKLVRVIVKNGHHSALEHASVMFAVDGISRAASHQIVRHRVGTGFSQQSQRYVRAENGLSVIVPPEVKEDADKKKTFMLSMEHAFVSYRDLLTAGATAEDARFVLPNAVETKMDISLNFRALLHFIRLRTCERAQWEIRALAEEMLRIVYPYAPTVFEIAGPACCNGKCPEGKLSCGVPKIQKEGLISPARG